MLEDATVYSIVRDPVSKWTAPSLGRAVRFFTNTDKCCSSFGMTNKLGPPYEQTRVSTRGIIIESSMDRWPGMDKLRRGQPGHFVRLDAAIYRQGLNIL